MIVWPLWSPMVRRCLARFLGLRGVPLRLREIINRGGEKVSPIEDESVLNQHPEVVETAVFALPHPTLGQDVAAAVVLRPASQSSVTDLRSKGCRLQSDQRR
jgi:oxalate---CoA ligase